MNTIQLKRFKTLFEYQLQPSEQLPPQEGSDPSEVQDDLDRASLIQEQLLSDTMQKRKAVSILSAKAALGRIRAGTFGICEECENEIDLRRLEIQPTTVFCIQCQEEQERQSRFMAVS